MHFIQVATRSFYTFQCLPDYSITEEELNQEEPPPVMELDESVEDAACQLWDMTAEKDIVHHILKMEEVDFFDLTECIVRESKSPRLMVRLTIGFSLFEYYLKLSSVPYQQALFIRSLM